jgi:hypothetical protein
MNQGKLAFAQIMEHLSLSTFRRCVARDDGEHKEWRRSEEGALPIIWERERCSSAAASMSPRGAAPSTEVLPLRLP